jgi:hypothetical protein
VPAFNSVSNVQTGQVLKEKQFPQLSLLLLLQKQKPMKHKKAKQTTKSVRPDYIAIWGTTQVQVLVRQPATIQFVQTGKQYVATIENRAHTHAALPLNHTEHTETSTGHTCQKMLSGAGSLGHVQPRAIAGEARAAAAAAAPLPGCCCCAG